MRNTNTEPFSTSEWNVLAEELSLSARQAQIARGILEGMSDRQIAMDLNMQIPTVRTHLNRLFIKVDAENRNQLVLQILRRFRSGCRERGCRL